MVPNRKQRRAIAATGSPVALPGTASKEPRASSEIQTEYGKLCAQLGEVTYRMKIDALNQESILKDISTLEREMKARIELDKRPQESK